MLFSSEPSLHWQRQSFVFNRLSQQCDPFPGDSGLSFFVWKLEDFRVCSSSIFIPAIYLAYFLFTQKTLTSLFFLINFDVIFSFQTYYRRSLPRRFYSYMSTWISSLQSWLYSIFIDIFQPMHERPLGYRKPVHWLRSINNRWVVGSVRFFRFISIQIRTQLKHKNLWKKSYFLKSLTICIFIFSNFQLLRYYNISWTYNWLSRTNLGRWHLRMASNFVPGHFS